MLIQSLFIVMVCGSTMRCIDTSLCIGVELNPHPTKSVGTQAKAVVDACVQNNLLILSCGPYDTIRLIPPLNITTQELQQGLDVFVNALNELTVE